MHSPAPIHTSRNPEHRSLVSSTANTNRPDQHTQHKTIHWQTLVDTAGYIKGRETSDRWGRSAHDSANWRSAHDCANCHPNILQQKTGPKQTTARNWWHTLTRDTPNPYNNRLALQQPVFVSYNICGSSD